MFDEVIQGAKLSKTAFAKLEPGLRLKAQIELRRKSERAVLVILAGDDRIGCNEVYDLLHEWLDARHLVSRTFAGPTADALERPELYRFIRELPPAGKVGIHFGGWPAATLLVRSRRGDESDLEASIARALQLERMLADDGTVLVKLWIHLPRKAHAKRIHRARKDPTDEYQVEALDLEILENFDETLPYVRRYLEATDADHAPWKVIDSSDDEHRNAEAARTVLRTVQAALEPRPAPVCELAEGAAGTPRLDAVDLGKVLDVDEYAERRDRLQARLAQLSRKARRKGVPCVLAFEGWDAAGKGGAIRRLTQAMAARDYRVVQIGAPTPPELARNFLWRFWCQLPRAGRTVIFDRTWYGRVLVERVEGFAAPADWRRAYGEINAFEEQLVESGCALAKFWMHIDSEEQLRRFKARESIPHKRHKITAEDYRNRDKWPAYAAAVEELLERTDTPAAPWTVVAGNDKRWARIQVLETVVACLEQRLD